MIDLTRFTTHRRGFLGKLAAAAALGMTGLAPARLAAQPDKTPEGSNNPEFEAWLGRIKGKHRQVFDAPEPNDGLPLAWSRVFLSTSNEAGTPDSDLCAVVVLRHSAIPLAMNDEAWAKYKFGELFKITDHATNAPAVRNVYAHVKPGELPFPDMAVEQLQGRGVLFSVCNMAITFYSAGVAKNMDLKAEDVKKDWIAAVLPGIQVVPSGVLAVNRAQEKGCSYCYAG